MHFQTIVCLDEEQITDKNSNILISLRLKLNKRSTESSELNGEVKEDKGGGVEQMAWLEWHLALCLISGERHAVIVDRGGEWRPGVLFLVFNPMLSSSSPSQLSPSLLSLTLCLSLPSQRVCLTLFITWPQNKVPGVVQDTSVLHAFVCAFKSGTAFTCIPSISRFLCSLIGHISNHIPFGLLSNSSQ